MTKAEPGVTQPRARSAPAKEGPPGSLVPPRFQSSGLQKGQSLCGPSTRLVVTHSGSPRSLAQAVQSHPKGSQNTVLHAAAPPAPSRHLAGTQQALSKHLPFPHLPPGPPHPHLKS